MCSITSSSPKGEAAASWRRDNHCDTLPEQLARSRTTEYTEHTEKQPFFFRVFRVFRGGPFFFRVFCVFRGGPFFSVCSVCSVVAPSLSACSVVAPFYIFENR